MTIFGYAGATSVVQGGDIAFHVKGDIAGQHVLTVRGVVGTNPPSITLTLPLDLRPPAIDDAMGRCWEGYGWPGISFTVPPSWPSGLYEVSSPTAEFDFVVLPITPGATSKTLVHIAYFTAHAYSGNGGKSLYGFNSGPNSSEHDRATWVSLDRVGIRAMNERPLLAWLESQGSVVECCSSVDLHSDDRLLAHYDCLVLAGHDEYWSKEIRDTVQRFIANGGNVIVLSGNTAYRQVRYEPIGRRLIFFKYPSSDNEPDVEQATVAAAAHPLNRPVESILGAGWTYGAFSGPAAAFDFPFPNHWALEGVAATQSISFMTYETDAAPFVVEDEGYPRVTGENGTPLSFTVLGYADLRNWGKPGFATMGCYVRNGSVFHAATTEWVGSLGDPTIARITQNVFARLSQPMPWGWEDVGHADFGRALASLDGRIFIATNEDKLWRRYPVGAEVSWRQIGHANNVTAMGGTGDRLWCLTGDNLLGWRHPVESIVDWSLVGDGPLGGALAMTAAHGMLYAVNFEGALVRRPARPGPDAWVPIPNFALRSDINALAAYGDILFASTTGNRLLRTSRDFIDDGQAGDWVDVHHCIGSVGLAVVEGILFVATHENRLWRLDLHGLRLP